MNVDLLKLDNQCKNVLDVGCGSGVQMKEFIHAGCDCVGVDLVKESALMAKANGNSGAVNADACHLPFSSGCFDIVYSNEFFSHVTDMQKALAEQKYVLKKGGKLLIRDSNFLCPFTLFDLLVLYPIRTLGKYGGLKWLFSLEKSESNIYGSSTIQKDENIKMLSWWRKFLLNQRGFKLVRASTSYALRHPRVKFFEQILGQIIVIAERT